MTNNLPPSRTTTGSKLLCVGGGGAAAPAAGGAAAGGAAAAAEPEEEEEEEEEMVGSTHTRTLHELSKPIERVTFSLKAILFARILRNLVCVQTITPFESCHGRAPPLAYCLEPRLPLACSRYCTSL